MLTQRVERLRALEGLPGAIAAEVSGLVLEVKECSTVLAIEVAAGLESSEKWKEQMANAADCAAVEKERVMGRVRHLENIITARDRECGRLRQGLEGLIRCPCHTTCSDVQDVCF